MTNDLCLRNETSIKPLSIGVQRKPRLENTARCRGVTLPPSHMLPQHVSSPGLFLSHSRHTNLVLVTEARS